ncbi:MAG: PIN domain-containing protein [Gemmatimonadota bacterium]|nr:MAG: PIN domain-containing protein [Gemmatimonadota bacterium]
MAGELALLDTGVLVAFLHRDDAAHEVSVEAIRDFRGTLLSTEAVLTEAVYLLSRLAGGPAVCLEFVIRGGAVLVPSSRESLARCKAVMQRYADLPADFADATLVALAEEMRTFVVYTLDRRGFSVYRGEGGEPFEIRPA